jgi:superfamily I DNA/RNA helicase
MRGSLVQRIQLAQQEGKEREGGVALMTMHASKGLEFPKVLVLGCSSATFPKLDSPIEEERRLMYVALTRAKSELHCTYHIAARVKSKKDGQMMSQIGPSVFLKEAGLA